MPSYTPYRDPAIEQASYALMGEILVETEAALMIRTIGGWPTLPDQIHWYPKSQTRVVATVPGGSVLLSVPFWLIQAKRREPSVRYDPNYQAVAEESLDDDLDLEATMNEVEDLPDDLY